MAGLAALARGDLQVARNWCAQAERSAEADQNRNGAMLTQIVLGLLAAGEGDFSASLPRLDAAIAYLQDDYAYDLSQDYERDLALALGLMASSRAALRLDQIERAERYCHDALKHAAGLNIDAFALMALIPTAEIALARGDLKRAAALAALVAEHPHTFAYDRAQAEDLLARLPEEYRSRQGLPDLWRVAAELMGS
jgi:ATP/maltotriose-dependent transcriptional regulator MalT